MRKLAHASSLGSRESRVEYLSDSLGYPELMSIDDFLSIERGSSCEPLGYMSVPEAKVEHLLHRVLPLRDAERAAKTGRDEPPPALDLPDEVLSGTTEEAAQAADSEPRRDARGRIIAPRKAPLARVDPERRAAKAAAVAADAAALALSAATASQIVSSPPRILASTQLRDAAASASSSPTLPHLLFGPPPSLNLELPGLAAPPPPVPSWTSAVNAHWAEWGVRQQALHDEHRQSESAKRPWEQATDMANCQVESPYYKPQQSKKQQAWHEQMMDQSRRSPLHQAREAVDVLHESTLYRSPLHSQTHIRRHTLIRSLHRSPSLPAAPPQGTPLAPLKETLPSTLPFAALPSMMTPMSPMTLKTLKTAPSVQLSAAQRHAQQGNTTVTPDIPQPQSSPLLAKLSGRLATAATTAQAHLVEPAHRLLPTPTAQLESSYPYVDATRADATAGSLGTGSAMGPSPAVPPSDSGPPKHKSLPALGPLRPMAFSKSMPSLMPSRGRLGRKVPPFIIC